MVPRAAAAKPDLMASAAAAPGWDPTTDHLNQEVGL